MDSSYPGTLALSIVASGCFGHDCGYNWVTTGGMGVEYVYESAIRGVNAYVSGSNGQDCVTCGRHGVICLGPRVTSTRGALVGEDRPVDVWCSE